MRWLERRIRFHRWELFARAAIFFVLVSEHLALTPRLMRLIDGRRWLVVAGRRFGRRRPHPGPVVLDDDDLGVDDPGQHQRRQQRQQVENEQQPRLARVQPDLQRRDVRLHPVNVGLHLAQPGVDALRKSFERGDGLWGDVALLLRYQCAQCAAQLRRVRGQPFEPVKGLVQRRQPRSTVGHHRQRVQQAHRVADGPHRIPHRSQHLLHLRDAWRQTRLQALVQRVEHGAVRLRLCAGGGDGLGSLPHFRPARRDEVVHPATPASTTPTPISMRPNPFSATSVALRSTNHAPKMPSRLRPMNSTARVMAAKRIVFSRIGILGSDVLFRSNHGYYLTRGGQDYPSVSAGKIPRNPLGAAGTEGRKPVASHRVYVPWFHRAISKSLKRNVRPLSRFVWLRCMTFRLVKSLSLAHQSTRHRKDTRNKALGSTLRTPLQRANDLDCRRAPRRRKAFRCARG